MPARLATAMLAAICTLTLVLPASAQDSALEQLQQEQRAIFAKAAPSVVFITHSDGIGSGFFVSDDGVILTNAHVVGDEEQVTVVLHDGTKTTAKVLERAADDYDLALVKIDATDTTAVPLADMNGVRVGNWVASVGHGEGGVWTYTTGMISNIYPAEADQRVFQTQIPLNPGNSGGPVVDTRGRAIGVVTAGLVEANSINFAIPIEIAMKKLDGLSKRCDCLVIRAPDKQPVFVDGVMVGKGPRVVLPAEQKDYEVMVLIDGKPAREKFTWPAMREVDMRGER
ncbi:MAG: S1C family serine protease [Persicimonas sp.]